MEEEELLSLCQSRPKKKFQIIPPPYWTAEIYSFGKYIREYGYLPSFLPLCIYTDHGPGGSDAPYGHELESDAPVQLFHSGQSVENWRKVSEKPCYIFYSPSVYYRRSRGIERSPDAAGTIAFPAHTTTTIEDISDIKIYIDQLLALPEEFQPVSACLHMHDINKGKHKLFQNRGIKVYTAGNSLDYRFVERFYEILRHYKYSTSNLVGSYAYYSVEMGIPFSIYGNKQKFINSGDPNITRGEWDPYVESQTYRKSYDLFKGLFIEITPEQKEKVEFELGLQTGISRCRMALVLYTSFFIWLFRLKSQKYIFKQYMDKMRSLFPKQ